MALFGLIKTKPHELTDGTKNAPAGGFGEVGVAGDLVFTGYKNEEARTDRISISDYRKMVDNDGTVQALYNILTLPILALSRQIKADENDTNEEQANLIRDNLLKPPHKGGMETPFDLVIEQMLQATIEGFQLFERVYKIQDGKYVYKKLAHRDSTSVKLLRADDGSYDGAHQVANYGTRHVDVILPAYKTFLFTYGKAHNTLYGRSAFKSAYRPYDKKRRLEYLDSVSLQNDAIKPKLLKRTIAGALGKDGKSAKDRALAALAKFGETRTVAAIPYGWDVDQGNVKQDGRDMGPSIERQNSEIARSLLASFILLGTQGSTSVGSWALSSDQSDMFMIALKGLIQNIENHINYYLIPDLIDLNFAEPHYPELHFDDLTSDVQKVMSEAFQQLVKNNQISEAMIKGIEQSIASRLEIDTEKIAKDLETEKKDAQNNDSNNSDGGNGGAPTSGAGFPEQKLSDSEQKWWRPLTPAESIVKFADLNAKMDSMESIFANAAAPILNAYIQELIDSGVSTKNINDIVITLPQAYVDLVENTIKSAYNYAKTGAADELKVPAPATDKEAIAGIKEMTDYVISKQQDDIRSTIADTRLASADKLEETIKADITAALGAWFANVVDATASAIVGRAVNNGRNAVFIIVAKNEDIYQYSALLDSKVCPLCESLDGKTLTPQEYAKTEWKPPLHFNCRCIWVLYRKLTAGSNTDFPIASGINDAKVRQINHVLTTRKQSLIDEGLLDPNDTKVSLLRSVAGK